MTVTVSDISRCLDEIAPFSMAESWDNVGLLIGDRTRQVTSLLLGLDPTNRLLDEALQIGADTVITHHPAIFKPVPCIDTADPAGKFLETALSNRLTVFACHTNFDASAAGVNDALADLLGLQDIRPLIPSQAQPAHGAGIGRIGIYHGGRKRQDFIGRLLEILQLPAVQVAGTLPEKITCVALCGGSGSEFAVTAKNCGADLYLSAEIKHSVARWAEEAGFCIIDGSHYATERPAVDLLATRLRQYAQARGWEIDVTVSATEKHPFWAIYKNS